MTEKARFEVENSGHFEVQYNPEKFQVDRSANWSEASEQGQKSGLEYQKTAPAIVSMELYFDTTVDGSDVRASWVNRLVYALDPHIEVTKEGDQGVPLKKIRPPRIIFQWGSFQFYGVVESLNTTYIMFSEAGIPIRAKVSLKLKEFEPAAISSGGGMTQGYSLPKVKLVQVQQGQSLSMLAAAAGTTAQMLAEMNGISNPLELAAGTVLKVPGS